MCENQIVDKQNDKNRQSNQTLLEKVLPKDRQIKRTNQLSSTVARKNRNLMKLIVSDTKTHVVISCSN
jgi:hypothetical protein